MNTLLRIYPPVWRERYGDELAGLLSEAPVSAAVVVDLLLGAIDAWLHPSLFRHAASRRKGLVGRFLLYLTIAVTVTHPRLTQCRGSRRCNLGTSIGA
ncbi:MAG TPA: hypothetical protein VFW40_13330 [Capsulimonadaceae bacterium]|nr:hypothetical protein [Capsulimonadaceae bacterium]